MMRDEFDEQRFRRGPGQGCARGGEPTRPGLRLHPLKGDLKGHWSVWVNGNWRITFRFDGADVELVDTTEDTNHDPYPSSSG